MKLTFQFSNQIKELNRVDYKPIIKCYGVTQDPQTKNYAFVLEYIPNGDLHHFIHKNFEKFTWEKKFNYLYSIVKGIKGIMIRKLYIEIYIVVTFLLREVNIIIFQ